MRLLGAGFLCAAAALGQNLLSEPFLSQFTAAGVARIETVAVNGRSFPAALRLETPQPGRSLDDATIEWQNSQSIGRGDRLLITFWTRKTAPADRFNLRARVSVESAPGSPLLDTVFPVNSNVWTRYAFDAVADAPYAAGELRLRFRHGLGPQAYELGGLEWTNRGPVPPLSVEGERVEPAGNLSRFSSYFDNAVGGGSAQVVPADGPGFDRAIQITTRGNSASIFNAALSWNLERSFARNDVMFLRFYARRLDGAQPFVRANAIVERNSGDFSKSLTLPLPVDSSEWRLFEVAFRMNNDYASGSVAFRFQFGAGPQRFEVGGISLLHFGARATLDQLPSRFTYPGRDDANAPWRLRARQSIEEHRQTAARVKVVDAAGDPVAGAEVSLQQLDHSFRFGSAVVAAAIMGTGFDNEQYRSRFASHFNTSVFENDLKWPIFECTTCRPSFFKEQTRAAIDWLTQRQIGIRGHVLIWPSWRNTPSGLSSLSPEALRQRIDDRFRSVLLDDGIHGKLYHWDVLNEPFDNFDLQGRLGGVAGVPPSNGVLGNAEAIRWFQLARELEPQAGLYLNDYNQFETGNPDGAQTNYTFTFLKYLLDQGAPVTGFGFQAHFSSPQPLEIVNEVVERYARAFPVDFAVTEFDVNTPDEAMQGDYTRDFTTYVFSQPRFTDFLMWGFWERRHWLPAGAMYRADWSSKPNAIVWNNLWFRDWWSHTEGRTDDAGLYSGRVFKGTYQIVVRHGDQVHAIVAPLTSDQELRVTLP